MVDWEVRMSPAELNDIAILARAGLKVFANQDQVSPGQIAGAAATLDKFLSFKDAMAKEPAPVSPEAARE